MKRAELLVDTDISTAIGALHIIKTLGIESKRFYYYYRFSPFVAITSLYQKKDFFLLRSNVPLPSSCLST